MFICQPLTPTDLIEIIGIVISLVTSVVAIVISVKTLKQNSAMIEESTRPYVVIYSQTTHIQSPKLYFIVKNFGQTGATVTSFECDYDLASCSYDNVNIPFRHLVGTFIAPGQSFITNVDPQKIFAESQQIHVSIKYMANGKTFSDSYVINPDVHADLVQLRSSSKEHDLRNISFGLQDLSEKFL